MQIETRAQGFRESSEFFTLPGGSGAAALPERLSGFILITKRIIKPIDLVAADTEAVIPFPLTCVMLLSYIRDEGYMLDLLNSKLLLDSQLWGCAGSRPP